jgi:U3 small nucleolar RNA-associated protein 4
MSFDPRMPSLLFVGLANNTLQIFDAEKGLFHEMQYVEGEMMKKIGELHDPVQGLLFKGSSEDAMDVSEASLDSSKEVIAWGSSWMCKIPLDKRMAARKRLRDTDGDDGTDGGRTGTVTMRYRNMLAVGFVGGDELVVVEKPVMDVMQKLPAAYFRARYGQ